MSYEKDHEAGKKYLEYKQERIKRKTIEKYRRKTYELVREILTDEEEDRLLVMKGMRQSGKTVIFEQLAYDLDGVLMLDASNDSDYEFICSTDNRLNSLIFENDIKYLLIDEVGTIGDIGRIRDIFEICKDSYIHMAITSSANQYLWDVYNTTSGGRCIMVTVPNFTFSECEYFAGKISEQDVCMTFEDYFEKFSKLSNDKVQEFNRDFDRYTFEGNSIEKNIWEHEESDYKGRIEEIISKRLDMCYGYMLNKTLSMIDSENRYANSLGSNTLSLDTETLIQGIMYTAYKGAAKMLAKTFVNEIGTYKVEWNTLKQQGLTNIKEFEKKIDSYFINEIKEINGKIKGKDILRIFRFILMTSLGYAECADDNKTNRSAEYELRKALRQMSEGKYIGNNGNGLETFMQDWNIVLNDTAIYSLIMEDLRKTLKIDKTTFDIINNEIGHRIKGNIIEAALKSQQSRFQNLQCVLKRENNALTNGEVDYIRKNANGEVIGCELTIRDKARGELHMTKDDKMTLKISPSFTRFWKDEVTDVYYVPYGIMAIILGSMGYTDNKQEIDYDRENNKTTATNIAWNAGRLKRI